MSTLLVIPLKAPQACKTRLAPALHLDARVALVEDMLRAVLTAANAARGVDRRLLLTPEPSAQDIATFPDSGSGLNTELARVLHWAAESSYSRMIVLHADLPLVTSEEIERLAYLPAGVAGVAPDRHEAGTNALSLPLPAAEDFRFAFGEDSFARHRAETARLGLTLQIIRSAGLGFDIDEPRDLDRLGTDASWIREAMPCGATT